ncbi:MAG TPA: P-type DNA transfer ATPase VirB11 [Alphaproteobacteria bacterium]|nr:P-type DNA transfer ATPase VirB11 [Alphaproteobacteria bacterium]
MSETAFLENFIQPIKIFIDNPELTEICINRPQEVFVEGKQGWKKHQIKELTPSWLEQLARSIAAYTKQDISESQPIVSCSLPEGERVQIIIPPATEKDCISFTIRKPNSKTFSLQELDDSGLFNETALSSSDISPEERTLCVLRDNKDWKNFFDLAVKSRKNIIISGATGSGKTTFSKSLIRSIPEHERILTIEDTRELVVANENRVHMLYSKDGQGLAKIGPKHLLESALRMRPDRIIMQELRDGTAFFYLRNVNSGHPGSITTVHANSAALAFEQLTLLIKESEGGQDLARDDIRTMLYMFIDIVVQMKKENGKFLITEVFYDPLRKRQQTN